MHGKISQFTNKCTEKSYILTKMKLHKNITLDKKSLQLDPWISETKTHGKASTL